MAGTSTLKYLIEFDAQQSARLKPILTQLKRELKDTEGSMRKTATSSNTMGSAIATAAKRAAYTIPLWLAMRTAMLSVFRTIGEGLNYIKELDKGLARARAVMHGVTDTGRASAELSGVVRSLGRDMGVTATEATEAFYRMGTAGLNVNESLEGMKIALKTSIAIMGDTTQTARGLADIYNLYGDRIENATTAQEKMERIGSTIAVLWKSNAFELSELLNSLKTFASTARNANLSLDEMMGTLAVLHTLMRRSSAAGTEMSRTLIMLSQRKEAIERFLDITDASQLSRFDLLIKILEKLNTQLADTGDIAGEVADIFGIKGMKSSAALATNLQKLTAQLKLLATTDATERMKILNELFDIQMNTIDRQLKIYQELKNQSVQSFVVALTGADNFVEALKKINSFMVTTLIPTLISVGVLSRRAFQGILPGGNFLGELRSQFQKTLPVEAFPATTRKTDTGFIVEATKEGLTATQIAWEQWMKDFKNSDEYKRLSMLEGIGVVGDEAKKYLDYVDEILITYDQLMGSVNAITTQEEDRNKSAQDYLDALEKNKDLMNDQEISAAKQVLFADQLKLLGYDQIEIEQAKLAIMESTNRSAKEREKQELKVLKAIQDQAIAYSEDLRKGIQGAIEDLIKGEATVAESFQNIGKKWADIQIGIVSESLSRKLFQETRIGEIFASMGISLREFIEGPIGKMKDGYDYHDDKLRKGYDYHVNRLAQLFGIEGGAGGVSGTTTTNTFWDTISGFLGMGGGIGGGGVGTQVATVGGRPVYSNQVGTGGERVVATIDGRPIYASQVKGGAEESLFSQAGGWGGILNAGMGGMQLADLYKQKGSGNLYGSAIQGGMAGYQVGSLFGPYGQAIGATLGAVYGAIRGTQSKTTEDWANSTKQITSKISVTNKSLEYVNRNLLALRNTMETFILPESAYFGTKVNLEDQFALSGMRGGS